MVSNSTVIQKHVYCAAQVSCANVETGAPRYRSWPAGLRQCVCFPVVAKSKIIALSAVLKLSELLQNLSNIPWPCHKLYKVTSPIAVVSITFWNGLIAASIILNAISVPDLKIQVWNGLRHWFSNIWLVLVIHYFTSLFSVTGYRSPVPV